MYEQGTGVLEAADATINGLIRFVTEGSGQIIAVDSTIRRPYGRL